MAMSSVLGALFGHHAQRRRYGHGGGFGFGGYQRRSRVGLFGTLLSALGLWQAHKRSRRSGRYGW